MRSNNSPDGSEGTRNEKDKKHHCKQASRNAWVARYETAAQGYAACQYLGSVGNTLNVHPGALAVQALHDDRTGAQRGLALA